MAYNIKFVRGNANDYSTLEQKDENTLYFTLDDRALYLGDKKFTSGSELAQAIADIAKNKSDIEKAQEQLKELIGGSEEGSGSIADMIDEAVSELEDKIGDVTELETEADTVVDAINEIKNKLDETKEDLTIAIEESTPESVAKRYTVKQGEDTIGTIDIPKDMVVESGKVITAEGTEGEGISAGDKLIELIISNKDNSKLYIPVKSLVDIYTAKNAEGAKVEVTVNNTTNEISATITAGAITSTELALNAVTSDKIASGAISKGKLDENLRTDIENAAKALQASEITEGSENGTIAVKGTDVNVHGLQSAAYAETSDFDPAGSADTAEANANKYTDTALTWGAIIAE